MEEQKEKACKFLDTEIIQTIKHEFCNNPELRKINKVDDNNRLKCMGRQCGEQTHNSSNIPDF